jgi:hypothetical protein
MVLPKDSFTTLNPMATTRSMKNDMDAFPASRIETGNDDIVVRGNSLK